MPIKPYEPPSWLKVLNTPRITDDTANVNKMMYSTESFSAHSATAIPNTRARNMPTASPGTKFQWWTVARYPTE